MLQMNHVATISNFQWAQLMSRFNAIVTDVMDGLIINSITRE